MRLSYFNNGSQCVAPLKQTGSSINDEVSIGHVDIEFDEYGEPGCPPVIAIKSNGIPISTFERLKGFTSLRRLPRLRP